MNGSRSYNFAVSAPCWTGTHERIPFYRSRLESAGLEPGELSSLDDLRRLPFTEKSDFRDNYPCGCSPRL